MNKMPVKQIYLLAILVIGIIAVSAYSTYAIFTLESETSDIVKIKTPNTLSIYTDTYEYRQLTVPKNSSITTDIDIYNNFNYELCYSIWYQFAPSKNVDTSKVKIYQNTSGSITTSGTIEPVTSKRINLIVTNDNNIDAKINVGLSYEKNAGTCQLEIYREKSLITTTINNPKELSKIVMNTQEVDSPSNYLTYSNKTDELLLSENTTIYISKEFSYKDELFTLNNPQTVSSNKLKEYINSDKYYLCFNDKICDKLYQPIEIKETIDNDNTINSITKYDLLIGYLSGKSGIRKLSDNYIYYGDNPNNFIYYNCQNELDNNSCELWRIIGTYYDKDNDNYFTKIIKDDYLTQLKFSDQSNIWKDSIIETYLDKEYKLTNDNLISEISFKQENITSLDITLDKILSLNNTNKAKVTIMNLSDYLNSSICENRNITNYDENCLKNNWLNKNNQVGEWTMSTKYENITTNEETGETITPLNNTLYAVNNHIEETIMDTELYIRPVIYLNKRTLVVSGTGTIDNPYVIK